MLALFEKNREVRLLEGFGIKSGHMLMKVCFVGFMAGILLFLFASSLQAQKKKYFDPWELGPFIEGDEVPPENMIILIRAATLSPLKTLFSDGFDKYVVPKVVENTNGLVKFKFYHGGVMGAEEDMIRKMKMKQIHQFATGLTALTKIVPEISVIGLPFLFNWEPELFYNDKYCEVDYVLERLEPSIAKLYEKGDVLLSGISGGVFAGIGTKIPLKTIEDLKKLKYVAFASDPIMRETNNRVFGMKKTINASLFELRPMISTGVIDSIFLGWYPVGLGIQAWPHINYATSFSYFFMPSTLVTDNNAFKRVVAFADKWGSRWNLKDGRDFARRFLEPYDIRLTEYRLPIRRFEGKAKEELIKRGIKEVKFTEGEVEKLKENSRTLHNELAGKYYPRWLLDEILKYRDEYRKLKSEGKLDEFHESRILPGGDQSEQWRTKWGDTL